jgi:hypothetical protein
VPKSVDFGATRQQAEDAGLLGGGGFYKYKEGDNRIRLMSECLAFRSEFKGQPNFKWLCYVLDRRSGKVLAHMMPHKIYKAIEALQTNADYAFSEVPMPYDVTVHAKGAGTKEVEYTVMPARKETALTQEEELDLYKQKPLEELKQALRDKQAKNNAAPAAPQAPHPADADPDMTDESIPF